MNFFFFVFIQNQNNFVSWPKGPTIRLITLLITRLIRLITNNRIPFFREKFQYIEFMAESRNSNVSRVQSLDYQYLCKFVFS